MYHCTKINIADLNPHLMCVLCGGYFIDATTIIECLHSFCRTCIVRYLESSKFCPICDVQVHKTRPLLNIRSDKTLQDLVYKLVPGLFEEEMRRRREFLSQHPEVKTVGMDLEQRGAAHLVPAHSLPEERISLVLELATPGLPSSLETHKKSRSPKSKERRYLLCPSDVSVGHLKKFIQLKFGLAPKYHIDVFYKESEETISDDFTLLDITFIYSWNRKKPLRLFYCVYEMPKRKRKLLSPRFLSFRPSQMKQARLDTNITYTTPVHLLHKSAGGSALAKRLSLSSSKRQHSTNGQPPSKKARLSNTVSQNRTKKKVKEAKNVLKRGSTTAAKIRAKRKPRLDGVKKSGHGRKQMIKTAKRVPKESGSSKPGTGPIIFKSKAKNGNKKLGSHLAASNEKLDTKISRGASPGFPTPKDSESNSTKPPMADKTESAGLHLQASFYRKNASTTATMSNGGPKSTVKVSHLKQSGSRSSSPKLATPSSSRSASPKLPNAVSKGSRCNSPKLTNGKDSPRPPSRSSRTDSPKPADLQRVAKSISTGPDVLPPSLPVEEKISVDVNMTASSSETSSDVTSPGAEDRANSTGLEEPGDFDNGGHVCNVAAFGPRSLPTLVQLPANVVSKNNGKGIQHKDTTKTNKTPQTQTKTDNRTSNNKKR